MKFGLMVKWCQYVMLSSVPGSGQTVINHHLAGCYTLIEGCTDLHASYCSYDEWSNPLVSAHLFCFTDQSGMIMS